MSQSELEKWNNKRKRKNNIKFTISILGLFVGALVLTKLVRDGIEDLSRDAFLLLCIVCGILMIWLAIDQGFLQRNRCTKICKAECADIYRTHHLGYYPCFRYQWEGESYVGRVLRYASKRVMHQRYVVGNEYEIYINPDRPQEIRVDYKIGASNILMLITGIFMLAFSVYAMFN